MDKSRKAELKKCAAKVIRRASRPDGKIDRGLFTMGTARGEIEVEMGFGVGELKRGEWKGVVKEVVEGCLADADNDEQSWKAGSSTTSPRLHSPSPTPRGAKKSKLPRPTLSTSSGKPSKKAKRSASLVDSENDEQEEQEEGVEDDERFGDEKEESDMSSVYDAPPKKRRAQNKAGPAPEESEASGKKRKSTAVAVVSDEEEDRKGAEVENGDGEGSESDMSSVYDIPPSRARSRKGKGGPAKRSSTTKATSVMSGSDDEVSKRSSKTAKKRKAKDPNEGLAPDEAKVADLKRIVVACGVRKQWGKEFADCPTTSSQISHLHRLLSSLGMKGAPTLGKAKSLKAKRELAAELDDVKSFEQARGVSSDAKRARRSQGKVVDPDDPDDPDEEDESAFEDAGKEQSALGAVLDFLGDESDSD